MLKEFEEVADGAKSVIQVFALGLISTVMILFVGLPLAIGGRPEALAPLALGGMAAWQLLDQFMRFQRTRRR